MNAFTRYDIFMGIQQGYYLLNMGIGHLTVLRRLGNSRNKTEVFSYFMAGIMPACFIVQVIQDAITMCACIPDFFAGK